MTSETLNTLRQQLKTVTVDGETFFVAEGDLLVKENELARYAEQRQGQAQGPPPESFAVSSGGKTAQLVGIGVNGRLVRWAPGVVLSYYLQRETFSPQEYAEARASVVGATEAWMSACGVEFKHLAALDDDPAQRTATPALFHVRKFNAGGQFIAAAFFPADPPERRRVLIDPSFFSSTLSFDRIGVLRHELGHVLGFRHEHIRTGAPPSCPNEDLTDTIDVTQYDPQSVMHYFCGGVGDPMLRITDIDTAGARLLYGPPLADFELIVG